MFLAGCFKTVNLNDIKQAEINRGTQISFDGSYDSVTAALVMSMHQIGVDIREADETDRGFVMFFSKPLSLASSGEVGRVTAVKSTSKQTPVIVYSEKRQQSQITGTTEAEFAESISVNVRKTLDWLKGRSQTNVDRVGFGRILGGTHVKRPASESEAGRAAIIFLAGGIGGLAASPNVEEGLDKVSLYQYGIQLPAGQKIDVDSPLSLRVGDCVLVLAYSKDLDPGSTKETNSFEENLKQSRPFVFRTETRHCRG